MTDSKVWREKDIRIARQSSIKASVNLLDVAERLGLLDGKFDSMGELYTLHGELADKLYNRIYKGME